MASSLIIVVFAGFLGSASGLQAWQFLPHGNVLQEKDDTADDNTFHSFVLKHGRDYKHGSAEYAMRQELFQHRLASVHAQNAKAGRLWNAATSHFSDRTDAELGAFVGYRRHLRAKPWGQTPASFLQMDEIFSETTKLPASKDWTQILKTAHHVRNQGSCGSCWAVATMSILEAHDEIYNNKSGTRTFSTQEIIHCTPNPRSCGGTGGCEGATVEAGMKYVLENGLATEAEYQGHGKCAAVQQKELFATGEQVNGGSAFGLMNFKTLKVNDDHDLASHLVHVGPVAVVACAGGWFGYSSGVYNRCSKDCVVDHSVTLFGYGEDDGTKAMLVDGAAVTKKNRYWKIRNSWGPSWGEKGFIRLLRQGENETHCGTDNNMQVGVSCKDDPKSATVCGSCGVLSDSVVPLFKGSPGHEGSVGLIADDEATPSQHAMRREARH